MIPQAESLWQSPHWQQQLREAVRSRAELLAALELPATLGGAGGADFPVLVPRPYLARMRRGDPDDPLLRQVLATASEDEDVPGYVAEPLAESDSSPLPGLIHKYRNRLLLTLTGGCAVNCRYCFRRHFPYQAALASAGNRAAILGYIARHPAIDEVILSGGDPLLLPDSALRTLLGELATLPQLRRVRLHTRLPVVLPQRVTPGLLELLAGTRLRTVVVLHCNHANEIGEDVAAAAHALSRTGALLLNQSVLLAGVNAEAAILHALHERLFDAGILPYYLHLLDPVRGAAQFAISDAQAQHVYGQLQAMSSGYLVPRLVRELPGMPSKILIPASF